MATSGLTTAIRIQSTGIKVILRQSATEDAPPECVSRSKLLQDICGSLASHEEASIPISQDDCVAWLRHVKDDLRGSPDAVHNGVSLSSSIAAEVAAAFNESDSVTGTQAIDETITTCCRLIRVCSVLCMSTVRPSHALSTALSFMDNSLHDVIEPCKFETQNTRSYCVLISCDDPAIMHTHISPSSSRSHGL